MSYSQKFRVEPGSKVSLRHIAVVLLLGSILAFSGCAGSDNAGASGAVRVVTTFSTLNSFVGGVGGKQVSVQNLVPVGASPETYQPTPQDIALLSNAQVLVENGAGIETWLDRTVANAGNPHLHIVVCSKGLPVKIGNPHLWMNPDYAKMYVRSIRNALVFADPQHHNVYYANARNYSARLDVLAHDIQHEIDTIPPLQRTMIVFHNAWLYYNERFGIRTIGVIEVNPGQDPNPQQIARLVDLAREHHVKAVFSEPEYSPKLAQALAQSAGIHIVTDLYDDSVGNNPRVHDYISMLRYDTDVIVKALK